MISNSGLMVHERSWVKLVEDLEKPLEIPLGILPQLHGLGAHEQDIWIQVTVLTPPWWFNLQTTIVSATCVWAIQDSD